LTRRRALDAIPALSNANRQTMFPTVFYGTVFSRWEAKASTVLRASIRTALLAACVRACPVGATYKDPETGIVRQDTSRCIGCRICMAACPYTGVRSFNWEEPQYYLGTPLGELDADEHVMHTVEKCILCHNRVERGLEPACIEVCPGRARHFGDLDDPDSEVSKLVASRRWEQLLPEEGTHPSVYYLV